MCFSPYCVAAIAACEAPQNVAPSVIGFPQEGQKAILNPFGVAANLSLAYNGPRGTTAGLRDCEHAHGDDRECDADELMRPRSLVEHHQAEQQSEDSEL